MSGGDLKSDPKTDISSSRDMSTLQTRQGVGHYLFLLIKNNSEL